MWAVIRTNLVGRGKIQCCFKLCSSRIYLGWFIFWAFFFFVCLFRANFERGTHFAGRIDQQSNFHGAEASETDVRLFITFYQTYSVSQRLDLENRRRKLVSSTAQLRFITNAKENAGVNIGQKLIMQTEQHLTHTCIHYAWLVGCLESTAATFFFFFFRNLFVRKWFIHQLCEDPSFLPPPPHYSVLLLFFSSVWTFVLYVQHISSRWVLRVRCRHIGKVKVCVHVCRVAPM